MPYQSRFTTSFDGLKLHTRLYNEPALTLKAPVICLPGLTRNAQDFHELAELLAESHAVLSLDYRGRGLSDYDRNWRNYDIKVEYNDVLSILTALNIHNAIFIGTSRGGLITMAIGAARPSLIRAAVLNDIGPVIEAQGLLRIRGYVGKLPAPRNFEEAVLILKKVFGDQFTHLAPEDWQDFAKATWRIKDGKLVPDYDLNLLKPLLRLDLEAGLPDLWPLFEGLNPFPLLALRGENSNLLSSETLQAMHQRHPSCEVLTVQGQGHAPLLKGGLNAHIQRFCARHSA